METYDNYDGALLPEMEGSGLETDGGGTPWSVCVCGVCVWCVWVCVCGGVRDIHIIIVDISAQVIQCNDFKTYYHTAPGRISWMLSVSYCENC